MIRASKRRVSTNLWKPHIYLYFGTWYYNSANVKTNNLKAVARKLRYNNLAYDFIYRKNFPTSSN